MTAVSGAPTLTGPRWQPAQTRKKDMGKRKKRAKRYTSSLLTRAAGKGAGRLLCLFSLKINGQQMPIRRIVLLPTMAGKDNFTKGNEHGKGSKSDKPVFPFAFCLLALDLAGMHRS